jgi:biopolymer transport protein TolQ
VKTDLSIVHLILNASFLVQLVLLALLLASLGAWTIIFRKRRELITAHRATKAFDERFWSGGSLAELYQSLSKLTAENQGQAVIFVAGFKEYMKLRQKEGISSGELLEGARRSMRVALNREIDTLEMQLPFLATVGSTSPYVGLFGTVWGIMNSFRALGTVQQATLAMVAPGIAEALIATAMGLFAAIPAVIGYNRYISDVERLSNQYDNFLEEFSAILQRQSSGG